MHATRHDPLWRLKTNCVTPTVDGGRHRARRLWVLPWVCPTERKRSFASIFGRCIAVCCLGGVLGKSTTSLQNRTKFEKEGLITEKKRTPNGGTAPRSKPPALYTETVPFVAMHVRFSTFPTTRRYYGGERSMQLPLRQFHFP